MLSSSISGLKPRETRENKRYRRRCSQESRLEPFLLFDRKRSCKDAISRQRAEPTKGKWKNLLGFPVVTCPVTSSNVSPSSRRIWSSRDPTFFWKHCDERFQAIIMSCSAILLIANLWILQRFLSNSSANPRPRVEICRDRHERQLPYLIFVYFGTPPH